MFQITTLCTVTPVKAGIFNTNDYCINCIYNDYVKHKFTIWKTLIYFILYTSYLLNVQFLILMCRSPLQQHLHSVLTWSHVLMVCDNLHVTPEIKISILIYYYNIWKPQWGRNISINCKLRWLNTLNIKGKTGKVKWKKMLKRMEECHTYLTHVCRHHWSRENSVKR